jgi:hypothetical protein
VDRALTSWRRTGARVAVVGLVAVLASACNPQETPLARSIGTSGDTGCQVGVVGDSLIVGARDIGGLVQKFNARGCDVTAVDAHTGRHTATGVAVIDAWASHGLLPRILVVGLGTNDCNGAVFDAQVRQVLAVVGPVRPVVWINTWRPGCDRAIDNALFGIQLGLDLRPDSGNLWILNNWQWVFENRGVLARDGIHLTAGGYRWDADRIVQAVVG